MPARETVTVQALTQPHSVLAYNLADWDVLVRQAREADLLPRLYALLAEHGCLEQIPEAPRQHLISAHRLAEKHAQVVRWEINRLRYALAPLGVSFALLKGAAYLAKGLPPARGRLFADIDILVPKASLAEVERTLLIHGWETAHHDAYDERYYRQWMHELPPMRHLRRQTTLDVHHTITPETARVPVDGQRLWDAAEPVAGDPYVLTLSPTDMVLHSAVHLFHDGELEHGLRDLTDLDDLLRHFSGQPEFWEELASRAAELGLTRPLYYALRYTQQVLDTPVPREVRAAVDERGAPRLVSVMDGLFSRALAPDHPTCDVRGSGFARWALYVRSHYLRMPLHLLLPHLLRKALRGDGTAAG